MPVALETVVQQLSQSGIIAPRQLKQFVPPQAQPTGVDALLRELVKQKHLTRFQAAQVAQGRAQSLILGGHTLLDKIGEGGMGQVFKAEHRRMKRVVAIKTLPAKTMRDAAAVARFQREVEAAARLRHPNIVAADNADESNGIHFLVMEYVEGENLSAVVKKHGPLPVAQSVNLVLQAARGLEFAHAEGVVHRDIKPSNLLVDKKGTVKILDMGLARINATGIDVATQAELTDSGAVMGTVDYMAPEQALDAKTADARADIYGLGCTLYYLIAGQAIYQGDSVIERILAHRERPIPSLRNARADVPKQLEAVFRKMVAKRVEDRYQTMTQVVTALEQCNAGTSTAVTNQQLAGAPGGGEARASRRNAAESPTLSHAAMRTRVSRGIGKNPVMLIAGGVGVAVLAVAIPWGIMHALGTKDRAQTGADVASSLQVAAEKPSQPAALVSAGSPVSPSAARAGSVAKPLAAPVDVPVGGPATLVEMPRPLAAPFDAVEARKSQAAWAKSLGVPVEGARPFGQTLVLIPPGEFNMGNEASIDELFKLYPYSKLQWYDDAVRQHRVRIMQPFRLGKCEVTIGQFRLFVNETNHKTDAEKDGNGWGYENGELKVDAKFSWKRTAFDPAPTEDHPVVNVSWNDAVAFCNCLSRKEGQPEYYRIQGDQVTIVGGTGYRLPTEAEWEYACRAGTTTMYQGGNDVESLAKFANVADSSASEKMKTLSIHPITVNDHYPFTAPVGQFAANNFGLHDMHGNAQEWCGDWWAKDAYETSQRDDPRGPSSGSERVSRGGNWRGASRCRSARRFNNPPRYSNCDLGFRVAQSVDATNGGLAGLSP